MEEEGSVEQTRELYERAVANFPPIKVMEMKLSALQCSDVLNSSISLFSLHSRGGEQES